MINATKKSVNLDKDMIKLKEIFTKIIEEE